MRKLLVSIITISLTSYAFAAEKTFKLKTLLEDSEQYHEIMVEIDEGKGADNMRWKITPVQNVVFIGKALNASTEAKPSKDGLMPRDPSKTYRGLRLHIKTKNRDTYKPIRIFKGKIYSNGKKIAYDNERDLEYWLFGTAFIVKQQVKATEVLPIYKYSQCVTLGGQVVETLPRQCLMSNDDLFLDVPERPTQLDLEINDFESCLNKGRALIESFPRRCVASGGRIFTEEAQLPIGLQNIQKPDSGNKKLPTRP